MTELPKVSSKYGAPMGRANVFHDPNASDFTLRRLRWVDGDYDEGGAYWGQEKGTHIYQATAQSDKGPEIRYVRAGSSEDAMRQVREVYPRAVFDQESDLEVFYEAYREAALFSSSNPRAGEDGYEDEAEMLGDTGYDIDENTEQVMKDDCAAFLVDNRDLIDRAIAEHSYSLEQAGHDFWLTRNGHGAGFWDRGLGEIGDQLADRAKNAGEVDLDVGDDNKIYDVAVPGTGGPAGP